MKYTLRDAIFEATEKSDYLSEKFLQNLESKIGKRIDEKKSTKTIGIFFFRYKFLLLVTSLLVGLAVFIGLNDEGRIKITQKAFAYETLVSTYNDLKEKDGIVFEKRTYENFDNSQIGITIGGDFKQESQIWATKDDFLFRNEYKRFDEKGELSASSITIHDKADQIWNYSYDSDELEKIQIINRKSPNQTIQDIPNVTIESFDQNSEFLSKYGDAISVANEDYFVFKIVNKKEPGTFRYEQVDAIVEYFYYSKETYLLSKIESNLSIEGNEYLFHRATFKLSIIEKNNEILQKLFTFDVKLTDKTKISERTYDLALEGI